MFKRLLAMFRKDQSGSLKMSGSIEENPAEGNAVGQTAVAPLLEARRAVDPVARIQKLAAELDRLRNPNSRNEEMLFLEIKLRVCGGDERKNCGGGGK